MTGPPGPVGAFTCEDGTEQAASMNASRTKPRPYRHSEKSDLKVFHAWRISSNFANYTEIEVKKKAVLSFYIWNSKADRGGDFPIKLIGS